MTGFTVGKNVGDSRKELSSSKTDIKTGFPTLTAVGRDTPERSEKTSLTIKPFSKHVEQRSVGVRHWRTLTSDKVKHTRHKNYNVVSDVISHLTKF